MSDHPAAERAALLALLDDHPIDAADSPAGWSAIAAEVALRGSAVALWRDHHPPALDSESDRADPRIDIAWRRLRDWTPDTDDTRLITILDDDYPVALRGIHQMPPLLFVKGALPAEEIAVSIVGARAATADTDDGQIEPVVGSPGRKNSGKRERGDCARSKNGSARKRM